MQRDHAPGVRAEPDADLTHVKDWRERLIIKISTLQRDCSIMNNVGSVDRIARILAGLLLIAFAIPIGFPHTGWNWAGWIGVVPLLTGTFAYCPAYTAFGVSTCSAKQQS